MDNILIRPAADEADAYPSPDQAGSFKSYFNHNGFIVVRGAIAPMLCEAAKQAFLKETLSASSAYFMRHASGRHERHVYTEYGFMKYPIMNIQDISAKRYPTFRQNGWALLTNDAIKHAIALLLDEPGQLVHTMYFDGNQTTWAHRDGHYIDSETPGQMIGVWVAAEDIHPDAGRFFVLPRSHRCKVPGEHSNPNGAEYKAAMAEFVKNGPLECVAPIMKQGDLLLWNSMIVHGSLATSNPQYSRRSFTGHYVPQSKQFKRHLAKHSKPTHCMWVNDVPISLHCDQLSPLGKLKSMLRSEFPRLYGVTQFMAR